MMYKLNDNIDLVEVGLEDINILLTFQQNIIRKMKNKEFFCPLTYQEFYDAINFGKVYLMYYKNDIAGLAALNSNPRKEILAEYLLGDIGKIGILDSIMVEEKYRGSQLQIQIMKYLEQYIKDFKLDCVVATVHPDNIYSLNNFLKSNYQIFSKIKIHNGTRYILKKDFNND